MANTTIDFNSAAVQQRAQYAANVLRNKTDQLSRDESTLLDLSRELVAALGNLKRAEAAQAKLGVNAAVENKVAQLRTTIENLRAREDVASRIVKAAQALIQQFLAEGDPTNRELLEAAKDYESAMAEVARI